MNAGQKAAVEREYKPLMDEYDLPKPSLLPAPKGGPGRDRQEEIWEEVLESQAEILILLGDKPIEWFLPSFVDGYRRLSDFGRNTESYGRLHEVKIRGQALSILPVVHPRQASRLGASSAKWSNLHLTWKETIAASLI
jgi:hypothetical protein